MIFDIIILALWCIFQFYFLILIATIILSWIPSLHNVKFFRLIRRMGDWYFDIFYSSAPTFITTIVAMIVYESIVNLLWLWM